MACAALWLNAYSPFVGPLASRTGGPIGSAFSVFAGLIVGVVYYLLAGRAVRARGRQPGPPLEREDRWQPGI